jgi:hypothetical protein
VEEYNRAKKPSDTDYIDYIASSAERVGLRFTMDQIDNATIGSRINEMEWWTIDVTKVGHKLFTQTDPSSSNMDLPAHTPTFYYR